MITSMVTGGAGFIGSHLVERLLYDSHRVVVVDNLATGRLENLAHVRENPNLEVEIIDVCDTDALRRAMMGVKHVYHLAALADIVPSIERPASYLRANVEGTFSVVEAARAEGVARFVYAASSSCYGLPDIFPTPESAEMRPQYPYALTKYLGEQIVLHWSTVYKLPCISLRLFNVFGPRARSTGSYGAVFGVFLAQKLAGKPLTVVGDGNQTRDFTFVTDVVEAFCTAARSDAVGEAINVGSGGTYRVNDLVKLLGQDAVSIPKRPGEPDCTFADTTKARRLLGWEPRISFEQGVRIMLDHLNDWHDAPVWDVDAIGEATRAWFNYLGKPPAGPGP